MRTQLCHPLNRRSQHHIRRIENTRNHDHAWIVEVRRRNRVTMRRFADGRHGGKEKALKAGVHFRDALLARLGARQYRRRSAAKPKPRALHHIQRLDIPKCMHAWVVYIRRHGHPPVRRRFSDSRYGGKRTALAAAMALRDSLMTEARTRRYWLWRRHRPRLNNTSGVIGIGRYVSHRRIKGRVYAYTEWQAFWIDATGKRRSRGFSVKRHGEAGARELARRARRAAMRAIRSGE